MDQSDIFADDSEMNYDSPPPSTNKPRETPGPKDSRFQDDEAHEVALKQELESIRKINRVVEGVVDSLEKAKGNMETVAQTVTSASTLLHTWSRILSQTEHNQRLILNPQWQGATRDIAEIENDEHRRRQEAQRRQLEEQQRKENAARKAEEEQQKRATASARGTRGGRGVNRGTSRPASVSSSGYGRVSASSGRGSGRAGATSGRSASTLGRSRGGRGSGAT